MNKGMTREYLLIFLLFLAFSFHLGKELHKANAPDRKENKVAPSFDERKKYFEERVVKKGGLRLHRAQYYKKEEGKE